MKMLNKNQFISWDSHCNLQGDALQLKFSFIKMGIQLYNISASIQ